MARAPRRQLLNESAWPDLPSCKKQNTGTWARVGLLTAVFSQCDDRTLDISLLNGNAIEARQQKRR
jgi:hypothetical protein